MAVSAADIEQLVRDIRAHVLVRFSGGGTLHNWRLEPDECERRVKTLLGQDKQIPLTRKSA